MFVVYGWKLNKYKRQFAAYHLKLIVEQQIVHKMSYNWEENKIAITIPKSPR